MKNRHLAYWTVPFVAYSLLGCNAEEEGTQLPIASSQAALTATDNSEKALQGLLKAVDFIADSGTFSELLDNFGGDNGGDTAEEKSCYGAAPACSSVTGQCTAPPESVCTKVLAPESNMNDDAQALRDAISELIQQLRDHVFTEENLESTTDTSVTYLLGPSLLCDDEYGVDPECIARAEFVQPRLRLTSPNEGDIDITLLVGAARHEPMQLNLYAHSLGWQVDLGQTLAFARDLGEEPEGLESLAGVLQLQVVENGEQDYSLRLNILEALAFSALTDSDEPVSVSVAASSPAIELNANGATRTLQLLQNWSTLRLVAPLSSLDNSVEDDADSATIAYDQASEPSSEPEPEPRPQYTGVIEMLISGFSSTISYAAESDEITISNLGYGDETSTLKHDGNLLAGLDFNADTGRRLAMVVKALEEGGVEVQFNPSLEAKLELAFHHIANQLQELPDFLLDDTLGLTFSGDTPTLQLNDEAIAITSGTLVLSSTAIPGANVTVESGMCLAEAADTGNAAHGILSSFAAVACL